MRTVASRKAALMALLDYSDWAGERVWRCVEALSPAQFTRPRAYSVGSIRDQLTHLYGADAVWLARMQGEKRTKRQRRFIGFSKTADILQAIRAVREQLREYLASLDEIALRGEFSWQLKDGRAEPPHPRWMVFFHLICHRTDHSSQILLGLSRDFQLPALAIDMSFYWRARRQPVTGAFSAMVLRRLFDYHHWSMARV